MFYRSFSSCTDADGTLKVEEVKPGPLVQADLDSNVRDFFPFAKWQILTGT